jgi:hypothetical protein
MKKGSFWFFMLVSLVFLSCQKELSHTDTTAQTLNGTWKLLYIKAHTNSTGTYFDGTTHYKQVTLSDYITKLNSGTITFDGSNLIGTGIGYTVDTIAKSYSYQNNVLVDSLDFPFSLTLPPSNSKSPYVLVGSDSLYFSSGGGLGGTGSPSTNPANNGARFTISGSTLTLKQNYYETQIDTSQGIPVNVANSASSTAVFQKQ